MCVIPYSDYMISAVGYQWFHDTIKIVGYKFTLIPKVRQILDYLNKFVALQIFTNNSCTFTGNNNEK